MITKKKIIKLFFIDFFLYLLYNYKRNQENAPIAQLDRAFGYGPKGCGFDSYWAHHFNN